MKFAIGIATVLLIAVAFSNRDNFQRYFFLPRQQSNIKSTNSDTSIMDRLVDESKELDFEVVAKDLEIPWEIVFLPDGKMLVTERVGKILKVDSKTHLIKEISGVKKIGEGGLLGMALHPEFIKNNFVYIYYTYSSNGKNLNKVERYLFKNDSLNEPTLIIDNILASSNHDGGRIAFGPDKYLYITTGDAENSQLAQNTNSLNGKILRITDTGGVPANNPFGNAVYSYGHRNPQGITWDKDGRLWATEHGPSGVNTGNDEINLIESGQNYGWPEIKGHQSKKGMVNPIIESGKSDTWAPAGIAYINNSLYFAGLRGSAIYKVGINKENKLNITEKYKNKFGRLRAVTPGPDGFLYVSTSNKDGRGTVKEFDDKIIRIKPF